jgi:hypothetical protein
MSGIVKAPCASCTRETSHDILHTAEIGSGDSRTIFDTLQCRGCQSVSLRERSFWNTDGGIKHSSPKYYPPPVSRGLSECAFWVDMGLPKMEAFRDLLLEVYAAAQNGLPQLAVMGIRAVLEQAMISKTGDLGTFRNHLEKFMALGYISLLQFDALDKVLEAGHATIHRSFKITKSELNCTLDIVEGVLAGIYIHPVLVEELSKRIPPRPPKRKPSKPEAPP